MDLSTIAGIALVLFFWAVSLAWAKGEGWRKGYQQGVDNGTAIAKGKKPPHELKENNN